MKALRFLAAGAAILAFAGCGKEYNSIPGGNDADNPILPLGTASEGQIRYNLWQEKIRIKSAYWSDTTVGATTYRQIVGGLTDADGSYQSIGIMFPHVDTAKTTFTSKDSVTFSLGFADLSNPDEPAIGKIYTNQVEGGKGGAMTVTFTQQDGTTLRGNFSGRMARQFLTVDTNDMVELNNGSFWVKKR